MPKTTVMKKIYFWKPCRKLTSEKFQLSYEKLALSILFIHSLFSIYCIIALYTHLYFYSYHRIHCRYRLLDQMVCSDLPIWTTKGLSIRRRIHAFFIVHTVPLRLFSILHCCNLRKYYFFKIYYLDI